MTTRNLAGTVVEVDAEGFFVDPCQWTEDMAPAIAEEIGIPAPLTDQHWEVITLMRKEYFEHGTGLTVRKIGKRSSVTTKELLMLFPDEPAKLAARVSGIPKPRGCY